HRGIPESDLLPVLLHVPGGGRRHGGAASALASPRHVAARYPARRSRPGVDARHLRCGPRQAARGAGQAPGDRPAGTCAMKIFDRYVLGQFLPALGFALLSFLSLFLALEFIDKLSRFLDHGASAWTLFRFFAWRIPYVLVMMCPIAVLLATFLTL